MRVAVPGIGQISGIPETSTPEKSSHGGHGAADHLAQGYRPF